MSFPFQGSETGQHRPPKRKEIRQFMNMFCYNHPKNMDHKKHCNEGKIMLAVKKIFFCFLKKLIQLSARFFTRVGQGFLT